MLPEGKKLINTSIPDYFITIFVFLVGIIFTFYFFNSSPSLTAFISGFNNPLIFSLYYLWLKGLFINIRRMNSKENDSNNFPGFVYWIYASQWVIYWMIDDLAYTNSRLKSLTHANPSFIVAQYFTNTVMFWWMLDAAASILLYPFQYALLNQKNTTSFVILDYLKFIVIFGIFGVLSIF